MDKKKIWRRVLAATAIGVLAAVPIILSYLRGSYEIELPNGETGVVPPYTVRGTVSTEVEGVKIGPVDIPPMEIRTPEDRERYRKITAEIVAERIQSDPQVAAARETALDAEWLAGKSQRIAGYREHRMHQLAEEARRELEELEASPLTERAKKQEEERINRELASAKERLEQFLLNESKINRPRPKLQVGLTEDQKDRQRQRVIRSVTNSLRSALEKQYEGSQLSAEERERIIQARIQEAVDVALNKLEGSFAPQSASP